MAALQKMFLRHGRDGYERSGEGKASGVLRGAKYGDGRIRGHPKGFDTLKGLLTIVQYRSHAVDGEIGRFDEIRSRPLTRFDGVMRFNVTIDFAHPEANVVPV